MEVKPDGETVCPGCGGHRESTDHYKCAYCRGEKERDV